jgi:hypothetical protein
MGSGGSLREEGGLDASPAQRLRHRCQFTNNAKDFRQKSTDARGRSVQIRGGSGNGIGSEGRMPGGPMQAAMLAVAGKQMYLHAGPVAGVLVELTKG